MGFSRMSAIGGFSFRVLTTARAQRLFFAGEMPAVAVRTRVSTLLSDESRRPVFGLDPAQGEKRCDSVRIANFLPASGTQADREPLVKSLSRLPAWSVLHFDTTSLSPSDDGADGAIDSGVSLIIAAGDHRDSACGIIVGILLAPVRVSFVLRAVGVDRYPALRTISEKGVALLGVFDDEPGFDELTQPGSDAGVRSTRGAFFEGEQPAVPVDQLILRERAMFADEFQNHGADLGRAERSLHRSFVRGVGVVCSDGET